MARSRNDVLPVVSSRGYNPQRSPMFRIQVLCKRLSKASDTASAFKPKSELIAGEAWFSGVKNSRRKLRTAVSFCVAVALAGAVHAQTALKSPWDAHAMKVSQDSYHCPTANALPHNIEASDFYSDAKHSVVDPARKAAYEAASKMYSEVSEDAERAADDFQKTGSAQAAACVIQILGVQAQGNAMTGTMSSNQANYVQNWTLGGLAVAYLKVRNAGAAGGITAEQDHAAQAWLLAVAREVKDYFQARRDKQTTDGRNNHLYWAGFAVMSAAIAGDDHGLYDWGVSTYQDGVKQIAPDGTMPLEMARGQRALHYHLFALAPLVTMAEMGEANGQDLYAYDHNMLHLAVSRALAGLMDNHYFTTKAGAMQDTPDGGKIKSDDVVWVTPYLRRFPDPNLRALLDKGGSRPFGYLGGLPPS